MRTWAPSETSPLIHPVESPFELFKRGRDVMWDEIKGMGTFVYVALDNAQVRASLGPAA